MANTEEHPRDHTRSTISIAWLTNAQAVYAIIGILVAAALGWGLWDSRALPFVPDIGTLLAHRAVGNYTLSMSHFFDLTGPSFARTPSPRCASCYRLPHRPTIGWLLRRRGKNISATISIALTSPSS